MILVKILGAIDLLSSFVFLMLTFSMQPYFQLIIFCAGLLLIKGLFAFKGELLSIIDLFSAGILIISLIFIPGAIFLWIPAFLLLAKGVVSFL